MNPKVSIVTPSFNQARYIEQCIRSVLDQDCPNVEHVIFDGGSKDATLDVLRRYEDRGVRWTSEPDKGQSDAINKGFRAATGDIIGWINSDDWYARGAFRVVLDYFREHPDAHFVYGNCFFADSQGRVIRRVRTTPCKRSWLLHTGLLIPQPGVFMRRRVVEECGVLDVDLHSCMDYEWWLRIARKHPPHFIDRYLAFFRLHEASKTGAGEDKPLWRRERLATQRKHAQPGDSISPVAEKLAQLNKAAARVARALARPRLGSLHCAPRAVLVTNLIPPYRVPVFNAISDRHDLEFQVWTTTATEDRQWQVPEASMRFPHRLLHGRTLQLRGQALENRRLVHLNTDLFKNLWLERPDAVIASEFSVSSIQAAIYCALTGAALLCWSETTPQYEQHLGGMQRAIRRWMLRRVHACVATSSGSREKFLGYGVPAENVFISQQATDIAGIGARCRALRADRAALRRRLGWSDADVVALYVGSFIHRKGLDALLQAFSTALAEAPSLRLALVGSGDQEETLKKQAAELGIADRLSWSPFRQQDELMEFYAGADLFVLPSRMDTFGVVVAEAMAAGLPVLCSRHAGASQDLVAEGSNGWVIDPEQPASMSQRLVALAREPQLRRAMGADSLERVQKASPETAGHEFYKAIIHGLKSCRLFR
jgi:glycosyltransferase involved in cell wall biosynthesis